MIFKQMRNHALFNIFISICELILYFLGHYPIDKASKNGHVLTCTGLDYLTWSSVDAKGLLFLFAHSVLMTVSAAGLIRTFYLIPKKAGVIKKYDFAPEAESEVSSEEEEFINSRASWWKRWTVTRLSGGN
jgi:hypothetical protein